MAIEDHPRYPEWRAKLDALQLAYEERDSALSVARPDKALVEARTARVHEALKEFFAISDVLD